MNHAWDIGFVFGFDGETVSSVTVSYTHLMAEKIKMAEAIKYSVIVVSSIPMLLLYPFVQKYFVKGVMIGAVKG